ncbi:MAG: hypothetical protein M1815_004882 [Lichina confinis]|nr:MAG: hypothetical protein M1815_004882 [Lichina confinis]
MPLLFNFLREESSKEYRLLRAKAMECATLIALAVGKTRLGPDAYSLSQLLASIQQSITDNDDPQSQYLMHCWGRMCRVLQLEFVPYLTGVMPPLMQIAGASADIQLLEDEEQVAQMEQAEGWELVPMKGRVVGIRTSTLEDKHMAIELIIVYAQVLEATFEPYVMEIMDKITLPGLAFFFHDGVRVASGKAVPQLLNAYKKAHGQTSPQLGALWRKTIEKVLEVLSTEPGVDTLAELYQCFYQSVDVIAKDPLTNEDMAAFVEVSRATLEDYQMRFNARQEERNETDEEGEEDVVETQYAIEDDQHLLSDMNKAFHTVFKHTSSSFLPYWQRLLPFCDGFVTSAEPTQRQWSLCVMDDVLEFCGPESWNYSSHFMQPLMDGMRDDIPGNRQAACYGVGVAAHKGGPAWADFVAASVPMLFQVIQRADARVDDHVFATENACAAIARVLAFNSAKVSELDRVVELWIDTLPIVNDTEVAIYAYSFLARLIEQNNPAVLSQPAKVFGYIAEALKAETLQGQAATRSVAAAKQLLSHPSVVATTDPSLILQSLDPDTMSVVREYFG